MYYMRFWLFCFFFCFGSALCRTTPSLDADVAKNLRAQTLKGLDLAYNFQFPEAVSAFDQAIAIEPLHPHPYLGKASITFWSLLLDRSDTTYNRFLGQADAVIDHADQFIDKYGKDADVLTCLGTIYGERAFAHGRMKSYLKAAWDGKKSHDYFLEALDLDRQWYDAYSGLGMYHYFASFMPKTLQWIVSILGVHGDAERGIKELELAANKGIYQRVVARFYLAELLPWHSEDFDSSAAIFQGLISEYPKNSIFRFAVGVWKLRQNDAAGAREQLQKIESSEAVVLQGLRPFVEYKLGECDFRLLNFNHAKDDYLRFLSMYKDETYMATANYRIGVCFEMAQNRSAALPFYRTAAKATRSFGDDAYASRRAEVLLGTALSDPDSMLIRARGLFHSGKYEQAEAAFIALMQLPGITNSVRAEATYGLGETFSEQHSYRQALDNFKAVVAMKLDPIDAWLEPWGHYQCGMCSVKLNEKAQAKKEFEKTLEYDDYDFQNWISYRAKRELEDLNK